MWSYSSPNSEIQDCHLKTSLWRVGDRQSHNRDSYHSVGGLWYHYETCCAHSPSSLLCALHFSPIRLLYLRRNGNVVFSFFIRWDKEMHVSTFFSFSMQCNATDIHVKMYDVILCLVSLNQIIKVSWVKHSVNVNAVVLGMSIGWLSTLVQPKMSQQLLDGLPSWYRPLMILLY